VSDRAGREQGTAGGAPRPLRLLIVLPSWVGDAVMATPALRLIRRQWPGTFIGALCRPGVDELLAGCGDVDEFHVERASGVMGPKFAAAKVRPRRYEAALLLTNSFSTALITRIAGIPRRVGYDRDCRGLLLTHRLAAPKTAGGGWEVIPACEYYWRAAVALLGGEASATSARGSVATMPSDEFMELRVTPEQAEATANVLASAGVAAGERYAVVNPGGNKAEKRWPAERFAALAKHLSAHHGLRVLVNGSQAESELVEAISEAGGGVPLTRHGVTLGSLKGLLAGTGLLVTNDTGPRHIAVAFGRPVVSLFGPTDYRWTVVPTRVGGPERIILADPTLPATESANDHPDRCRIDRIELERVVGAVDEILRPA
jgi:heptosyltransferase-2